MGMGNSFETITVLQYRLKEAQEELAAFQSGEKYIRMEKQHLTQVRALERRIANPLLLPEAHIGSFRPCFYRLPDGC